MAGAIIQEPPMIQSILTVLSRDLATVEKEISLYPSEASLWIEVPGLGNAGGNLALHLAGNLQHFIGAILGGTGYVRDRDAEFTRRGVPRAEVLQELHRAAVAVATTLTALEPAQLAGPYPQLLMGNPVGTEVFLVHLCAHLAYHLGQLDSHRRIATGQTSSANAQSLKVLG
jgi:hypothetical protein